MLTKSATVVAFVALLSSTAMAQDARTVIANASKAMGADAVKSIQFDGMNAAVGQSSTRPTTGRGSTSPRAPGRSMRARTSYEDLTRRQGANPLAGDASAGRPAGHYRREQRQRVERERRECRPQPAAAELRQLDFPMAS